MATTVHGGGGALPARPKRPFSLQDWLESTGAVVAFAVAALAMMLRGAEFYSGGAFHLSAALGPRGITIFNALCGLGLAVGCELVGSIAGRDWLYQSAEALEVEQQRGMTKPQRAARKKAYAQAATRAQVFMYGGFAFSFAAAASYAVTSTGAHTWPAIALECLIAAALEGILAYLGVFKTTHRDQTAEVQELGFQLFQGVLHDAAERIRHGLHSMQDVRLVAQSFQDKRQAERFQAAYMTAAKDDPIWTTRDIMKWLGDPTSEALRKRINRKLKSLMDAQAPVWKDDATGGFRIAKSDVGRLFMDDFLGDGAAALATRPGHPITRTPESAAAAAAVPGTEPTAAHPVDIPGTLASA